MMMLRMKLHLFTWIFLAFQRASVSSVLRVKGIENKQLNFNCSHSWAATNIKYFCRRLCRDKDVLIRSVGLGKTAHNGRVSVHDGGGQFTVSINRLMKSDQGQYWCGVERAGIDTYQEVTITVLDASQVTAAPKTTNFLNSGKDNTHEHTPTHTPTHTQVTRGPGTQRSMTVAVALETTSPTNVSNYFSDAARHSYIPVCVCGLLITLVLSLALYFNQVTTCRALTARLSSSRPFTPRSNTRRTKVNEISSGCQNPNARNPVYVNMKPSIPQTNSVYETLHVKAIRVDPVYDSLVSGANQSDQQELRKKPGRFRVEEIYVSNEYKPVEARVHVDK